MLLGWKSPLVPLVLIAAHERSRRGLSCPIHRSVQKAARDSDWRLRASPQPIAFARSHRRPSASGLLGSVASLRPLREFLSHRALTTGIFLFLRGKERDLHPARCGCRLEPGPSGIAWRVALLQSSPPLPRSSFADACTNMHKQTGPQSSASTTTLSDFENLFQFICSPLQTVS